MKQSDIHNYILYPLRTDMVLYDINENGQDLLYFEDELEIVNPSLKVPLDLMAIFEEIEEPIQLETYLWNVKEATGVSIDAEKLMKIYTDLDFCFALESPRFEMAKNHLNEYKVSKIRPAICAGVSYSPNPDELKQELDTIVRTFPKENVRAKAKALMAPHLDFRLGNISALPYSSGFQAIEEFDGDLIVIFGTAHYRSTGDFMLTRKHYNTPLGTIETDLQLIDKMQTLGIDLHFDDLAHKPEHSIEMHLVLLQHLLKNKNVKVLPILTGTPAEYIANNKLPMSNPEYYKFVNTLKTSIYSLGRKALFLASGDLSHIGRRFGDDFDAATELDKVANEDSTLVTNLVLKQKDHFFYNIASNKDKRKVCGTAPFYALLNCIDNLQGVPYHYSQWDDKESGSAVTCCSIAFY